MEYILIICLFAAHFDKIQSGKIILTFIWQCLSFPIPAIGSISTTTQASIYLSFMHVDSQSRAYERQVHCCWMGSSKHHTSCWQRLFVHMLVMSPLAPRPSFVLLIFLIYSVWVWSLISEGTTTMLKLNQITTSSDRVGPWSVGKFVHRRIDASNNATEQTTLVC